MIYYFIILGLLTSCSMYRREFDCCPKGEGIPCTSVTTLEKMIVESCCGPEIFLGCVSKPVDKELTPRCKCAECSEQEAPFQRRILICPKEGQPAYIYFEEEVECDEF